MGLLSARSDVALRALAGAYAAHLRGHPGQSLYDIAHGAAFRRDWHDCRACVEGDSHGAVAGKLVAFAHGAQARDVATAIALEKPSAPAFVYSGNGSQWAGMGRALLAEEPVFREAVRVVDEIFARHGDFSLLAELEAASAARLELTEVAQPTLFAVQVGITEVLRHWGVEPAAVVGHSVGEVAAESSTCLFKFLYRTMFRLQQCLRYSYKIALEFFFCFSSIPNLAIKLFCVVSRILTKYLNQFLRLEFQQIKRSIRGLRCF